MHTYEHVCKVFLKDYGNMVNQEVTDTTILEVWRSSGSIEIGWKKKKMQ